MTERVVSSAMASAPRLLRLTRQLIDSDGAYLARRAGGSVDVICADGRVPDRGALSALLGEAPSASPSTSELALDGNHDALAHVSMRGNPTIRLGVVGRAPRQWTASELVALADLASVAVPLELPESDLHRTAMRHLPQAAVMMFDRELRYVLADGEALFAAVGLSREELLGTRVGWNAPDPSMIQAACSAALGGEVRSFRVERTGRWYSVTVSPVADGAGRVTHGMLVAFADSREAYGRDALTNLLDRRAFFDLVASRAGPGLLVFADLDGLKSINDTLGHAAGDRAIRAAADAVRRATRAGDLVARIGGDELVAFVAGETDPAALARRIRAAVRRTQVDGRALEISVGVVDFGAGSDLGASLERADREMYRDKAGKRLVLSRGAVRRRVHRSRR